MRGLCGLEECFGQRSEQVKGVCRQGNLWVTGM